MTLVVIFYYQYLFIVQDNSNMALLSEKKFSKECVRVCVKVTTPMKMMIMFVMMRMLRLIKI